MGLSIQQQIVISQQRPAPDKWEHYRRNALIDLDRLGVESLEKASQWSGAGGAGYETAEMKEKRLRVWANESLVWCIDRIREGRDAEALRAFIQAREYNARVAGSFCIYPVFSDALATIQQHFEEQLLKLKLVEEVQKQKTKT